MQQALGEVMERAVRCQDLARVLGSWGKPMRDAEWNKERWKKHLPNILVLTLPPPRFRPRRAKEALVLGSGGKPMRDRG